MEITQGIKIHNRFDIEVRDSITGELKQTAQAENILLDSIYTRLCGGSSYFVNIHFGTGTGTTVATRTSLFTHLGTKTAVDEELVKAIPISSWKRKIVLAPEEYVGQTITEVGIAWGSTASYLMTHAMIKDAEGNSISITKTDTDLVTIYATVYVTFSTAIPELIWLGIPNSNTLMNYLIGGSSAPTGSFGLLPMLSAYARLGSTPSATWTSDVVNKKRKTNIPRFDINTANGNALVLEFTNLFQLKFPATGIHTGRAYANVPLGIGNGAVDTFALPSQNLISGTLAVKIDGVTTTAFTSTEKEVLSDQSIPNNVTTGQSVALNSDGTVLAVGSYIAAPYLKVWDWSGTAWIERAQPLNIPTNGQSVSLNSDGTVLAMGSTTSSPYLKVWDWSGTAWIERAQAPNIPTNCWSVALNSDGTVLAMAAYNRTPYLKVWDWSGTAWIERAQAPNIPTWGYSVSLNSDGTVLAMGSIHVSPHIKVWDWSGTAWIERAQAPNIPTSGTSVSLNSDGTVLAMGSAATAPYLKVWDWSGTAWIERAQAPNAAGGQSVALNSDGTVLAVGSTNAAPWLKVYNNQYITQADIIFNTVPVIDAILTVDYTVKGVHKTTNQVIDASFAIQFGEGV